MKKTLLILVIFFTILAVFANKPTFNFYKKQNSSNLLLSKSLNIRADLYCFSENTRIDLLSSKHRPAKNGVGEDIEVRFSVGDRNYTEIKTDLKYQVGEDLNFDLFQTRSNFLVLLTTIISTPGTSSYYCSGTRYSRHDRTGSLKINQLPYVFIVFVDSVNKVLDKRNVQLKDPNQFYMLH